MPRLGCTFVATIHLSRRPCKASPTTASPWPLPVEPCTQSAAHDELLVGLRQPLQLLREHRHALPPGARHARDVGAPEHALGAKGIIDLADVRVNIAIGIRLARVARRSGGL